MGFLPGTIAPAERELWVAAIEKLEEARGAIDAMRTASHRLEFEHAWGHFLDCLQLAFVRLHTEGKKMFSSFQPWVGRYESERKNDPLLQYLYQARHQVQHGLVPITWSQPHAVIGRGFMGYVKDIKIYPDGTYAIDSQPMAPDGKEAAIEINPGEPVLVEILNKKHNQTFAVPSEHLGSPIANVSPIAVAQMALSYHENMIAAAINKFGNKRPIGKKS